MTTVNLYTLVEDGVKYGFDMGIAFFPSDVDAVDASWSSTTFRLYYDYGHKYYDEFIGSGFTYDAFGVPVGGQISQWNYYWNGTANMKVSGLNMSVATYMSFATSNDWTGFLQAALAGNDTINGSSASDVLYAYGGNDTVNAGDYYDQVWGGDGNDILTGAGGDDDLYGEDGNDTLSGGAMEDWLYGGEGNDKLSGGIDMDKLYGDAGDDKLDGGAGVDLMAGGTGNDSYYVDDEGDLIQEFDGDGFDTVKSTVNFTAGNASLEIIELVGSGNLYAIGSGTDNTIIGTAGNNEIYGNFGNDILRGMAGKDFLYAGYDNDMLDGGTGNDYLEGEDGNDFLDGGVGNDWLRGGHGNDTYVVDSAGDLVEEFSSDSNDLVISTVTYTLPAGLEHLTLQGAGTINGTGNTYDNRITGNDAANLLDGKLGNDILVGGKGNDTYVIGDGSDLTSDLIEESISNKDGGGIDTIVSVVEVDLADYANVDNATLTGTVANHVRGNDLSNVLTGNDNNNLLDGRNGADTLIGGKGSDIYIVDNAGDKIVESIANGAGGGDFDSIEAHDVNFSLAGLANVEDLTLVGAGKLTGTGNAAANMIMVAAGYGGSMTLDGAAGNDTLYGAEGHDTLIGGAGNDTMAGGKGDDFYRADRGDTIQENDGEGTDTIEMTSILAGSTFDLNGAFANIENFTLLGTLAGDISGNDDANALTGNSAVNVIIGGLGNDQLFGNAGNDVLDGGADDDLLDGGAGNDKLTGGSGNDTYVVDAIGDVIVETGSDSDDLVQSTATYALSAGLEHLTLLGTVAINGTGNELDNTITGNDGANILDGKTGADHLIGGKGNDTYVVDDSGDVVEESISNAAGGGVDTVQSAITFDLTAHANIENLTLTGALDVDATGNAMANKVTGNTGANRLDGGAGNDTLTGGAGNDTYILDTVADKVVESLTNAAGGGIDSVEIAATYSLSALANVDNLTLQGGGNFNGTGNALNNVITGNSGDNVLDGGTGNDTLVGDGGNDTLKGGAGIDLMQGGSGNDIYLVDSLADTVDEEGNGDLDDEIRTSLPIAAAVTDIEHYTYSGAAAWTFTGTDDANKISGGSGIDKLSGGLGNDQLFGNAGNDELDGGADDDLLDGGAGNDKLTGGSGNDTYVVNATGDVIVETGSDSDDLVQSTATHSLSSGVEHLVLLGGGAINGTGNELDNTITGNTGSNLLDGGIGDDFLAGGAGADKLIGGVGNDTLWGGAGLDTLTGGNGSDRFTYAAVGEGGIGETITDFAKSPGGDVLDLRDLLDSVDYAGSDAIADGYVQFAQVGADTVVRFDANGGGDGFQQLVTIKNTVLTAADSDYYQL